MNSYCHSRAGAYPQNRILFKTVSDLFYLLQPPEFDGFQVDGFKVLKHLVFMIYYYKVVSLNSII